MVGKETVSQGDVNSCLVFGSYSFSCSCFEVYKFPVYFFFCVYDSPLLSSCVSLSFFFMSGLFLE